MENLTKQQRYREKQKEKGKKQITVFLDERQFYKLKMICIRRKLTYSDLIEEMLKLKNDTIYRIPIRNEEQREKYNEAKLKFKRAKYRPKYDKNN